MVSFASSLVALVACLSLTSAAPTTQSSASSQQTYNILLLDSTQTNSYSVQYGYAELTSETTKTICKSIWVLNPSLDLLAEHALAFEEAVSTVYYDTSVLDCTSFQENESETVTVESNGYESTLSESVSISEIKCCFVSSSSY
jgi:hypothetical protein